jgi:carbonic anhydrase/acetyltransferase-like protein (isoleucine patch superfamily)
VIHTDPGQPTTIGSNVTVGHRVILHSTTIGDGSLIGMGSVLLNRSKIGKNCLIGANTLIAEGKEIPDNSLVVGAPGRVVRELSEQQRMLLRMSADVYVENYARFKRGLRELVRYPARRSEGCSGTFAHRRRIRASPSGAKLK